MGRATDSIWWHHENYFRIYLRRCLVGGSSLLAETADEPVLRRCLVSIVEEARVPAREAGVLVELSVKEDVVSRGGSIARIDDSRPRLKKKSIRRT